eukprot:gene13177-9023_t
MSGIVGFAALIVDSKWFFMWLDWQFIDFVIGFGPIEFLWFDGLDFVSL